MRGRARIGLLTLDMKLAAKLREISKEYGVEIIHSINADQLPLDVDVVIASRNEGLSIDGRRVVYCEDFESLDECLERALEVAMCRPGRGMVIVAIDPGKSLGAAFLLDNFVLKTRRYGSSEELVSDVKRFLSRHREAERKYVVLGATTNINAIKSIMRKLEDAISGVGATIMVCDESFTTKGILPKMKGISRDEYSALVLSLKSILGLG
ncbi:MAG: hypothetical protein QXU12_04905 [Nitrososphaerota archaeon]